MTWNAHTMALAVAVGCIVAGNFFFTWFSLISVPAIVFFPAYSIHFFADRYPPLKAALVSSAFRVPRFRRELSFRVKLICEFRDTEWRSAKVN